MGPSTSVLLLVAALGSAATATAQDWKGRARIDGRVSGEGGGPVAGATVSLDRISGRPGPRLTTDARGIWSVDGIAWGSWMVVIAAPGYRVERVGVHIPGESSWLPPVEVQLQRPTPRSLPASPASVPAPRPAGEPATSVGIEDVRAALVAGRVDRAAVLLAALDTEGANDAGGLSEVGRGFLAAGASTEAAASFDLALDIDPECAEARYRRGLARLALGQEDGARDDFEAVAALRPEGEFAARARRAVEALRPGAMGE